MSKKRICQSCGLVIGKDHRKWGTEYDGITRSDKYCNECYLFGQFTNGTRMTVEEFQDLCRRALVEDGYSRIMAWILTRGMSRLERWRNGG
ncbi:MAG: zinc ribbon domain-containing protein [Prevotellaceae bacterium]|nr:zinc ribbon domain-containing protein [Prevotellaceae bacterium]